MTEQSEKINLNAAMDIFEDNLDEISDALAINIMAEIEDLPPLEPTDDENLRWVLETLREAMIEKITQTPLKVIKRIQSRKYYMEIPQHEQVDRITPEDIARAKETPIENLYDGQLKSSGGRMWGLCPFHQEKTSSFCIHKDNRWSCFGENIHGDVIDYIQKRDNVNFIQAVRKLINK